MQTYFKQYRPFFIFLLKFFSVYVGFTIIYQIYLNQFESTLLLKVDNFTQFVARQVQKTLQFFNFDSVVINSEKWLLGIKFGMFDSVPNILTGLGIFGTFVGIVIGLPETLQGDIALHMEEFIRGMRVAFGTSILGLIFSLIFTFFDKSF